ncbi:MAG: glycoside hydrolase family 99-like domain-containing protein [Acidobacteria bacterium]|nr:glycoside hydrolase family 99-like domain-containing protein [Acidobacteriota bacterium]
MMPNRRSSLLVFAAGCLWLAPGASAAERRVLAFYYNWYGTPAFQNGKWAHWEECTGCTHDPGKTVRKISPRDGKELAAPDTGTTNHPPELYDSNDPSVIRRHLKMAERAGIDALIVTWWGKGQYHDRALRTALEIARAAGSKVKFTIYYETVPHGVSDPVAAVVEDFRYLREQYGSHPNFFTVQGKPVFFVYDRALGEITPPQWAAAARSIRAAGPAVLIADRLEPMWLESFDGLNEYCGARRVLEKADMSAYYRDIVKTSRARGKIGAVSVFPGYDDSHIGRERPTIVDRRNGDLYRRLWRHALAAAPDWVLITSFNEWHEGTEIEPSLEWGDRFLNLTRDFTRKFKKASQVR